MRHAAGVSPWQGGRLLLELLGGREFLFGLGLERRAAGDLAARFAAAGGRDVAAGSATPATLPPADGGGGTRLRRHTTHQNRKLAPARTREPLGHVLGRRARRAH